MEYRDIDHVIDAMDLVIERTLETDDPRGYFACVYRAVTARVRDGLSTDEFEDPDRMHDFDVRFAALYLDALDAYERGAACSSSWRSTFDHAARPLLVLQHVLLGMNSHICLDLGVAAARTVPGAAIVELEADFERINDVLATMVDRMQLAIATVSPLVGRVDRLGGRFDEAVATWSLAAFRGDAWRFAERVATARDGDALIAARDAEVARRNEAIARPGRPTSWVVAAARRRERAGVATVAEALRAAGAPLPT